MHPSAGSVQETILRNGGANWAYDRDRFRSGNRRNGVGGRHPLASEEGLDRAGRGPHIHLLADEGMGHGVEIMLKLDVIVGRYPRQLPFGVFVILSRKRGECRAFHGLEHLLARLAKPLHHVRVDPFDSSADGCISFLQRDEGDCAVGRECRSGQNERRLRLLTCLLAASAAQEAHRRRNGPP